MDLNGTTVYQLYLSVLFYVLDQLKNGRCSSAKMMIEKRFLWLELRGYYAPVMLIRSEVKK